MERTIASEIHGQEAARSVQTKVERLNEHVAVITCPQPTSYTGVVSVVVAMAARCALIDTGVGGATDASLNAGLGMLGLSMRVSGRSKAARWAE